MGLFCVLFPLSHDFFVSLQKYFGVLYNNICKAFVGYNNKSFTFIHNNIKK